MDNIWHIVLDAACVVVFIIMMIMGWKKGFFKMFRNVIILVLAILLAVLITNIFADAVTEKIEPLVTDKITETVADVVSKVDLSNFHDTALKVVKTIGLSEEVADAIVEKLDTILDKTSEGLTTFLAQGTAKILAKAALFVGSFIVLMIVLRLLSKLLESLFKLPGLNFLNRFAGLLIGAAEALIIFYVASYLIGLTSWADTVVPNTVIFSWLSKFDLLNKLLSL